MTEPLFLGVDASTTACKALVVDAAGRVRAEGRAVYPLQNPEPDAWEQRAEDWRRAAIEALGQAAAKLAPSERAAVEALAIANQRETFVVTDERGQSLAPAIVWMDARARPEVVAAASELDPARVHAISGKPACVTPSLYKIRALFERLRPDLGPRARLVLDVHAYLVLHLTGERATSLAAADPLGMVDMERRAWSSELAALARVDERTLPPLFAPGEVLGALLPEVASATGLRPGLPVVAGAGDGQAAGLGAGVLSERSAYLNLGTAVVSGKPSERYRTSRAYRTLFAAGPEGYLLETDLKGGTFTLDWLADRVLGAHAASASRSARLAELEALAEGIAPGSDGLIALPYWAGVMNPYWDDDATGALVGLRGDHGPEHVYRAILEGIALEQRLHFSRVEEDAGPIDDVVAVGGGAGRGLFASVVADVLGRPLQRPAAAETTALGAAILAALGAGAFPSVREAARAMTRVDRAAAVTPGPHRAFYDELYGGIYVKLYPALAETLAALAAQRGAGPRG